MLTTLSIIFYFPTSRLTLTVRLFLTYSLHLLFYLDVFFCTKSFFALHPYPKNMTTPLGKTSLSESRQPQLYAAYSITYALAVIAVGLRISARRFFSKAGIWLDDYAICVSLVIAGANFVDMIICKQFMTGVS